MFNNLKEMISASTSKYATKEVFLREKDGKYVGVTYGQLEKDMNFISTPQSGHFKGFTLYTS